MANELFRMLKEGEYASPDERISSRKFVDPETRDEYSPVRLPNQDGMAHDAIMVEEVKNSILNTLKGLSKAGSKKWHEKKEESITTRLFDHFLKEGNLDLYADELGPITTKQLPALIEFLTKGEEDPYSKDFQMPFSEYFPNRSRIKETYKK